MPNSIGNSAICRNQTANAFHVVQHEQTTPCCNHDTHRRAQRRALLDISPDNHRGRLPVTTASCATGSNEAHIPRHHRSAISRPSRPITCSLNLPPTRPLCEATSPALAPTRPTTLLLTPANAIHLRGPLPCCYPPASSPPTRHDMPLTTCRYLWLFPRWGPWYDFRFFHLRDNCDVLDGTYWLILDLYIPDHQFALHAYHFYDLILLRYLFSCSVPFM